MVSSFSGLEIAGRALQSQQMALDITGQNIANASTSGYTRQIVNLQATDPVTVMGEGHKLQMGTGVTVADVTRAKDAFVSQQLWTATAGQQYWTTKQNVLGQVQGLLNEPSTSGLSSNLDQFWNAWSELSSNPTDMSARSALLGSGQTLVTGLNNLANQTMQMQQSLNDSIKTQIQQINNYAQQIGQLNGQIKQAEVQGGSPNDLLDKRDGLVSQLSNLVNVKVVETPDTSVSGKQINNFSLIIGDPGADPPQYLVQGTTTNLLEATSTTQADGSSVTTVTWADGQNAGNVDKWNNTVNLGESGALMANIEMRGYVGQNQSLGYLPNFLNQLNQLANGVATAVNTLHSQGTDLSGYPGGDFFVASDSGSFTAANIEVNPAIAGDPTKIAAAAAGLKPNSGDGSTAQAISSLADGLGALLNLGVNLPNINGSLDSDYQGIVTQIGTDTQQSNQMVDTQNAMVSQLANQQQSVSGVSLDEEMINLSQYQRSYQAAAHLVSVMDGMLNTLVNDMGVSG